MFFFRQARGGALEAMVVVGTVCAGSIRPHSCALYGLMMDATGTSQDAWLFNSKKKVPAISRCLGCCSVTFTFKAFFVLMAMTVRAEAVRWDACCRQLFVNGDICPRAESAGGWGGGGGTSTSARGGSEWCWKVTMSEEN